MAERLVLLLIRRSALQLVLLAAIVSLLYTTPHAQSFQLDLNDFRDLQSDVPWDTLRAPIDRLQLGLDPNIPNFLPSDFARDRVVEEYVPYSGLRLTFRVSPSVTFESEEVREGVFIRMTERPVDSLGVTVSVATIDDIAEERFAETIREEWSSSTKRSINEQDATTEAKKGLLNISIPVALPGAVEKIIGQGEKTNIDISGRESITFAGETQRTSPFYGAEGLQKQSLFPSLDMKQELDVRLQGQIGEKINLQVDHTSSSSLESQNRIRLNYTGFDDDVVKLIELGNTSLSLPGSGLISFAASRKGLFGIKTFAQAGPVDLTVIASKEEGEVSRASFSPQGGQIGQLEERLISDKNFVTNTYFFLDRPPDKEYPDRFIRPKEGSIDIYRSVPDNAQVSKTWGQAYVDSLGRGNGIGNGEAFEKRQFKLLTAIDDYRFVLDAETEGVIGIELIQPISRGEVLAVSYVNEAGDTIGDFEKPASQVEEAPLLLELIWPSDPLPQGRFGYTWAYMMRNIYNLGLSNIDASTLELEIEQINQQLNPTMADSSSSWLQVFGLDQTDETGTGKPDKRVDLLSGVIDLQDGILTFPSLTPFDPDSADVDKWTQGKFAFTGTFANLKNPGLYTKLSTDPAVQSLFSIVVRAASTTRTFRIDAFNITEGSEVITVDGQTLERNRDYKIDYETGEVELVGGVQINPSSNITVDYEYKPLAGGTSSTLLGFNSIWSLSKNSRVGTTWLYESKASSTVRPRLGEEPTKTVVGGFDANLQYEPEVLTSLVNLLPLVDTDAKSTFGLNGGVAFSFPDPNTQGEAYIDDMEGVEDSDVLSLVRRSWYPASPPVDPDAPTQTLAADKRAKIYWYNIEPDRGVHRRDLNPDLDERESTLVPSLDIEFDTIPEDSSVWGGVMTGFRGGIDLSQSQFLEIWVNDFRPDSTERKGTLHIDLGYIDEDFYRPDDNHFDNEDANRDGFTIGGTNNEDTGLDGILTGNAGDDPDDDYVSRRIPEDDNRFTHINGTEANGLQDSEDLDGSSQLETSNAYFTFTVDLAASAVTDIRRDFRSFTEFTDDLDSWRFYRVDLSKFGEIKKDGVPVIEQIKEARIWITDVGQTISPNRRRLQIADLKIAGNRWEKDGIRTLSDSLIVMPDTLSARFALGVISNKTDPAKYSPPVRPNVQNEISEKEQSLLVKYDDIEPGTGIRILKRFTGTGQNLATTYNDLNFFVHTDQLDTDQLDPGLEYFFRLGFDSLSYYEVDIPLTSEFFGSDKWAGVSIALTELTGLKLLPADSVVTGTARDLANPDIVYPVRMVGSPSLFNVRYLFAGLRNKTDRTVSGELWIDDIYLGNRNKSVDSAQRFTGSIGMGNIINLSGSWTRTGPDYVPFGQSRGSATETRSLSLNAKTNVEYFVPMFGFSVPITGNYSRNTNAPKYMPNSDTEITGDALQDSMKSEGVTRGFSSSLTRTGSKNPLLVYTFDKLRANYSMSQSMQRTPSGRDTTTSMNGSLDYSITWGAKHSLRLFKNFGIRYLPNSFNYRISASRTEGRRYRAVEGGGFARDPVVWDASVINSGSITYVPVPSLTSSFRMQTERDLDLPHEVMGVDIGQEVNRSHAFQASYKPPPIWLVRAFSPDFNYSTGYREDSSPNVRKTGDPYGVRNVSANREVSVKLGFDLGAYLGKVFGAAGLIDEKAKSPGDQRSRAGPETRNGEIPPPDDGLAGAGGERKDGENKGGQAAADSAAAPAKRKTDPLTAVRKLADVLSSIRKINASFQQGKQSSYARVPGAPSLAYQLGLTTASGVEYLGDSYDDPERIQENKRISMDSGVQLTRNIDVAGRFGRTTGATSFRESETNTSSTTWPDLSLSWKGLETFGPFRGLFTTASATMTYNKSTQETGKGDAVQTHRETANLIPSVVFQWKNTIQSAVGVQYSKELSDTRGSVTEGTNLGVSLDLKYAFTPGKAISVPLPFLKNKTLKSRLDTSLNASYATTGGRRSADQPGRFIPVPGTQSIKVSPRVAYNFTTALNGSFFIDYSRTHSDVSDQTTTVVRVGITATFGF